MLSKIFSLIFFSTILITSFQLPVLKDKQKETKSDNSISWDFDDDYPRGREEEIVLTTNQASYEYRDEMDFFESEPNTYETKARSQTTDRLVDMEQGEMDHDQPTTRPFFIGTFETEILYPSTTPYTTTVKLRENEEYIDIDQKDDSDNLYF